MDQHEVTYSLAATDFDATLLPPEARTPATDEFQRAVSDFYVREYANFGGTVKVAVTPTTITVRWQPDAGSPKPLDVALKAIRAGDVQKGLLLLELLRQQAPDSPLAAYNLGLALSDAGELDAALRHLRHAQSLSPRDMNSLVAIGVALARQRKWDEAATALGQAVAIDPDNHWAQRNLGACLLEVGKRAEGERALRRAVELAPNDQHALYGLAEALRGTPNEDEADKLYVRVIEIDGRSPVAERARQARTSLAHESFRSGKPSGLRPDAVMYLVGALQKFGKMDRKQVQQVAFEIAMLGQRGLDTNDPSPKYTLRTLPGTYSGLQLVSLMYAGFKVIDPSRSIGFDLSKEYQAAQAMHRTDPGKPS